MKLHCCSCLQIEEFSNLKLNELLTGSIETLYKQQLCVLNSHFHKNVKDFHSRFPSKYLLYHCLDLLVIQIIFLV